MSIIGPDAGIDPASAVAPTNRGGDPPRRRGDLGRLYALFLRHQLTGGRAVAIVALGAMSVLMGLVVRVSADEPLTAGTELVNRFGFTLFVPVAALVFASSVLGDLVDDRTLVYVWMTPVPRRTLALAATLAAATVVLPLVFVPLVLTALATGAGPALVGGTALATLVGAVGYTGVFVAVGFKVRRALVWGIAYILIWEGFVATASETAAKLSLRAYTASILSQYTGVGLRLGTLTLASAIAVPIVVAAVGVAVTTWLLGRARVD